MNYYRSILFILFILMIKNGHSFNARLYAIGETNHDTSHGLEVLIKEVRQIRLNREDDITRIFIEGSHEYKSLYRNLSFDHDQERLIKTEKKYKIIACHSLWINQIIQLFPIVRSINLDRKKRNISPLVVVPIDSISVAELLDIEIINVDDTNLNIGNKCINHNNGLIGKDGIYLKMASYNREKETAEIFLEELSHLPQNEKGLIFYHQGHLFKSSAACIPKKESSGIIDVSARKGSWLQIALSEQPLDIHVAAIDHGKISNYESGDYYYGVMGSKPNYINELYYIFYEADESDFDSIIDLSNESYYFLDDAPNEFKDVGLCRQLGFS